MSVLRGIGAATPDFCVDQRRAAEIAAGLMGADDRRRRSLGVLYQQTGVERRQSAVEESGPAALFAGVSSDGPGTDARMRRYREAAPGLAERACREALHEAGVEAAAITHLVVVSCTGFHAPGVDAELVTRLGLPAGVQRTVVGFMGCHGAINGLRVASAFASADPNAEVLLCCVEICSVHFQYKPADGAVTANALFGDGAAACIVSARGDGPRLSAFGARMFPDSGGEMGWRVGDHGFVMSLSARVPVLLREGVAAWMDAWLGGLGRSRDGVGSWAIHPGGPRIVEAVRASLGLGPDATEDALAVLRAHGNMSSPTILFILRRMLARGADRRPGVRPRPGGRSRPPRSRVTDGRGANNPRCGTPGKT